MCVVLLPPIFSTFYLFVALVDIVSALRILLCSLIELVGSINGWEVNYHVACVWITRRHSLPQSVL